MISPGKFLDLIDPKDSKGNNGQNTSPYRIGTIPSSYSSGRPQVQFDGESTASTKAYPYLSPYVPVANDRVLLARVGAGWVVLGKIT